MNEVRIKVTQEHIDKGKPRDCGSCPIALAAFDAGLRESGDSRPEVTYSSIYTSEGRYSLPLVALDFIGCFDRRENVQPFKFTAWKIAQD